MFNIIYIIFLHTANSGMRKGNVSYLSKALEHVWFFSWTHPSGSRVSDGPRQSMVQCYVWSVLSVASDAAPSWASVPIPPLSSAKHLNTLFQLRTKDGVSISLFIYLSLFENCIAKLLFFSLALKLIFIPTLPFWLWYCFYILNVYTHTLNKLTLSKLYLHHILICILICQSS